MNARSLDQNYLQTQLLGRLVDTASARRPMLVLDAGLGVAETVDFFCDYRCRLHFSSFFEVLERPAGEEVPDEDEWFNLFRQAMDYPSGTKFDLILFWDLFSYLEDAALRGFMRALLPYVGRETVAHGFAVANAGTIPPSREYGILNREQLTLRPLSSFRPPPNTRGRSRLADLLSDFKVARTVLHQGGLLEISLSGK